jgi:hypothetical protein
VFEIICKQMRQQVLFYINLTEKFALITFCIEMPMLSSVDFRYGIIYLRQQSCSLAVGLCLAVYQRWSDVPFRMSSKYWD